MAYMLVCSIFLHLKPRKIVVKLDYISRSKSIAFFQMILLQIPTDNEKLLLQSKPLEAKRFL